MRLPHCDDAVVPLPKLTEYLLSESHPVGCSKATFFRSLGFREANASSLETGLLQIAQECNVIEVESSPHGVKYVIDGAVATPLGEAVVLRTVWIVESEGDRPRFVTAYPARSGS
jgi:hypothetical protein